MKEKKNDILFFLLCAYVSFLFAYYRCKYGDFIAYNGDFQNYNIFRRILNGQVQYRDFVNYLGVGCTIINLPLVAIFKSFGASVFITNFTACIAFCGIIFVASYVMTNKKNTSYIITLLCAFGAFALLKGYSGGTFYYKYIYNVAYVAELGHSMRTTRGMLPYIVVAFFYIYKKRNPDFSIEVLIDNKRKMAIIGFIMGALIPWSNDFGFANVGCFFIIIFLIEFFGLRKKLIDQIKLYIIIGVSVVLGLLAALVIVTKGSVTSYLKTTASIADYQFWYYQNTPDKFFTIFDYFKDFTFAFLTIIFFVYAFWFLYKLIYKSCTDKEIIRLFLLSSNYAAALIYVYGSGHHNYYMLQLITYFCVVDSVVTFIRTKSELNISEKKVNVICICVIVVLAFLCSRLVLQKKDNSDSERVKVLNIDTTIGQGLNEKADEYKNEMIFSTYATALETINGIFQPTGIDYIIHVLGDEEREKYIENFVDGNYKYATTLKNDYTTWEYWAIRVNWFFYRELYKKYTPKDQTNYSVIWEKTEQENVLDIKAEVEIEKIDASTCVITVKTPGYKDGAYVDLKIAYDTEWTKARLENLALRKCVSVADGGEKYNNYNANSCYYIKEKSDGYYIPVYITDGEAQITISSKPISCTKLVGLTVSVEDVISVPKYDLNVAYYTSLSQGVISDSIVSGRILKFVNTETNYTLLKNANKLKIGNTIVNIEETDVYNDFIYVHLEDKVEEEKVCYPNNIETICDAYRAADISDEYWISGIKRDEPIVLFENKYNFDNLKYLESNGNLVEVEKVEEYGSYVWVKLKDDSKIRYFGYPNYINFIYK